MLYDGSSSGVPMRVSDTYDQHPSLILSVSGRAIYSKVARFLSGVAWTILVARICQFYPNAVTGTVVCRFYILTSQWCAINFQNLDNHFTSHIMTSSYT